MKSALTVALLLASVGCSPSYEGQKVKTPDELLDEQDRAQQEAEASGTHNTGVTDTEAAAHESDAEKKAKFDDKQAELEMKRAARSAETCAGVVTEAGPSGTAKVHLTFGNDGHVSASDVDAPFKDTATGKCVLRAMSAVIVPPFAGDAVTRDWDVEVAAGAAPPPKKK